MKKLLLLTLALSLPLAQMMRADNNDDKKKHKKAQVAAQQEGRRAGQPPAQQVQRKAAPTVRRGDRQRTTATNQVSNRNVDRGRPNSPTVLQQNRGNRNFNRNSFAAARTRIIRVRHDRVWWRNRFHTTFVVFGGGYYYWDAGYWYPAYGYSPIYNNYAYNEPIYGYDNLPPGQVLENVQLALRDQGYYRGRIDGLIGPETRGALAAYQRDHGLLVTSAVDEPTLVTLGLA